MARRGKFFSWSKKGIRVGYGRRKKQVVKTGCCVFLAIPLAIAGLILLLL